MANENTTNLTDRRRRNWIRLIQQLLDNSSETQLRDIYMLLRGYLGIKNE